MLMRMIAAAGTPMVGSAPDFEDVELAMLCEDSPTEWAQTIKGRAVKVLDGHRLTFPNIGEAKMIWLQRDAKQQATSMLRFLRTSFALVTEDRASRRAMEKSILRDTPVAIRSLQRNNPGMRGIALQFERVLADPMTSALVICRHLQIDPSHAKNMAAQVWRRGPECLAVPMEASLG